MRADLLLRILTSLLKREGVKSCNTLSLLDFLTKEELGEKILMRKMERFLIKI